MTLGSVPVSSVVSSVTVSRCFVSPCLISLTWKVGIVLEVPTVKGFSFGGGRPRSVRPLSGVLQAHFLWVSLSQPRTLLMLLHPLLGQYAVFLFIFMFSVNGKLAGFAQRMRRNVTYVCDITYITKSKHCFNGLRSFWPLGERMSDPAPHQSCVEFDGHTYIEMIVRRKHVNN